MLRRIALLLCLAPADARLLAPRALTLRGGEEARRPEDIRRLPLSELRNKAVATLGLPEEEVDEALDSGNPRQSLIALIERNLEHTRSLKLSQLCRPAPLHAARCV